jgi:hypothetical protein
LLERIVYPTLKDFDLGPRRRSDRHEELLHRGMVALVERRVASLEVDPLRPKLRVMLSLPFRRR